VEILPESARPVHGPVGISRVARLDLTKSPAHWKTFSEGEPTGAGTLDVVHHASRTARFFHLAALALPKEGKNQTDQGQIDFTG